LDVIWSSVWELWLPVECWLVGGWALEVVFRFFVGFRVASWRVSDSWQLDVGLMMVERWRGFSDCWLVDFRMIGLEARRWLEVGGCSDGWLGVGGWTWEIFGWLVGRWRLDFGGFSGD
jgi:hypothetical protein